MKVTSRPVVARLTQVGQINRKTRDRHASDTPTDLKGLGDNVRLSQQEQKWLGLLPFDL